MRKVLTFSVTLILILAAIKTGAQNSKNVDFIGASNGPVRCVAVQGNFAYAGAGGVLLVLDVSNPGSPSLAGKTVLGTRRISDIRLRGSYAYLLVCNFGFKVVDISEPSDPHEVGYYLIPETSRGVYAIYISGSYAFVAASQGCIKILDISDPTNPHEVGSCLAGTCFLPDHLSIHDLYVSGSNAYVCDCGGVIEQDNTRLYYEGALRLIDITDFTNPHEVGSCFFKKKAIAINATGSYIYVGTRGGGLRIVDVSDPAKPHKIKPIKVSDHIVDIAIMGSYAYMACSIDGVKILDISDASAPCEVGSYLIPGAPGRAHNICLSGSYAYVAAGRRGIKILDVSDPGNPYEIGAYAVPVISGKNICVSGTHAYLAASGGGANAASLEVVDVSDPTKPLRIGACDISGDVQDLWVSGSYAYIAAQNAGLRIVDISNSYQPREIGFYETSGLTWGVCVSEHYACVVNTVQLMILDVSDPANPSEIGRCKIPGTPFKVHISGSYACVAAGAGGLSVVDISDPANPYMVGNCRLPRQAMDVYISGAYAYVITASALSIIDISDPSNPHEVGSFSVSRRMFKWLFKLKSVYVSGSYAYISRNGNSLRVLDISVPSNPREVGWFDVRCPSVYVIDSYIYVCGAGISIFRNTLLSPGDDFKKNAAQQEFVLHQNNSNPNGDSSFVIPYRLSKESEVRLAIYNSSGQVIKTLVTGRKLSGQYAVPWDGTDSSGKTVVNGLYFYQLKIADFAVTRKLLLVR